MLHVRACTPPACPHAHVHKCIHAMECAVAWRHWFTASSSSTAAAPSPISPPPSSALSAPAASDAWSRRETGRWEQRGCVGASSPGDGSAGPRCCCARQLSVAVREGRHKTGRSVAGATREEPLSSFGAVSRGGCGVSYVAVSGEGFAICESCCQTAVVRVCEGRLRVCVTYFALRLHCLIAVGCAIGREEEERERESEMA